MAKELTTTLRIAAEATGVEKLTAVAAELEKMAEAGQAATPEFARLADEFAELTAEVAEAQPDVAALTAEMQRLRTVAQDRDLLGVRAHAEVQKEIDETRAAYERLKASGTLTGAELAQAALKTEERVRELRAQTNGWAESLGRAKTAFAGLAASGAGIGLVVNEAVKFESAMSDVTKTVDGTDEQIASLTRKIKELSGEIPLAAGELAGIAAAGGQLGVPMEQLEQFIRLAATMATAFNMSAEQASEPGGRCAGMAGLKGGI